MSPSSGNVNKGLWIANLLTGIVKKQQVLSTVVFKRINKFKVYSTHKLKIFNFLLHNIAKRLGMMIKKVNFVKLWLKCSNFQPIVNKLLFSSFWKTNQWNKDSISCTIYLVHNLGEGYMYPAALHKIPTQTVDSSQVFKRWILQKQPKMINKMTKSWDKPVPYRWLCFCPIFLSFCWSSLIAFGEFTFQKLVTNQLFGLEFCAVRQDTCNPHQDYEQVALYKKWSLYFIGSSFKNWSFRKNRFWHHLFSLLLEETVLFTTKRACKIQYLTRVCNYHPIVILHIAGWRIYNGKSVIVKSCNIVRGKRATVPILELWDTVDYLLERNIIHFRGFFQQHQTCQLQQKSFVLPIQWVQ